MVKPRTLERTVGFDPHLVDHVVSLSKTNLLIKSTGNTQKTVALTRHEKMFTVTFSKNETKQIQKQRLRTLRRPNAA